MKKMKRTLQIISAVSMLCIGANAQVTTPVLPAGKIAVFKAGTSDNVWPMISARVTPCYVNVYDTASNNQPAPWVSVAMSTNSSVPGSVWINHHAGSEGGGLSRSVNRQFLALEGYTGNILTPTSAKPSTDGTVYRGIVTLDAFTNAVDVYHSLNSWFGIPVGAATGTQDNPTGIASLDGTNFWGTGNFAGVSGELDGTLFYNPNVNGAQPVEVQNFLQAAGQARIIGGMLLVATKPATTVGAASASGLYNFVDPSSGQVVPLPWSPNVDSPYYNFAFTNLYLNWGSTFVNILNFDMNPQRTIAYGADQKLGIAKFVNNGGVWTQAPYYFSTTNIGTRAQAAGNQGCFSVCVDFSGANPIIYATTMENGTPATNGGFGVNTAQGHQNNNRLIKIVDTGISPGTNYVAQTLALAQTTNEFFGGLDFTPDLTPLITSNPSSYSTTTGATAPFSISVDSVYALSYQWLQNGTNLSGATSSTLNVSGVDLTYNGFTYQCLVSNNYGAVTSTVATLTVTASPVAPTITSGTNSASGFITGGVTFPAVSATGTQPYTYQWYFGGNALSDGANPNSDGSIFSGTQTASLSINSLTTAEAGNYYLVVSNTAGYASNKVDVLTVNYHVASVNAGQPASVTTFVGTPTTIVANETGGTLPLTFRWYKGTTALSGADYSNVSGTYNTAGDSTLTINALSTNETATNYNIVFTNPGGSVTSSVAAVTVTVPPAHSFVAYSNQVYSQTFDSMPDPGTAGQTAGLALASGVSVNSINNPMDAGIINGVAYSLANPFDFAYPAINNSYIGGLNLSALSGWYGAADTNAADGTDAITRFGAQNGDQSTGGVIDFGLNDVNGGVVGTNRALGLLTTSTTGSTSFGLKLINKSGSNLNYITISFLGQLWRENKASRTMSFSYVVDPANSYVLQVEPTATNTDSQIIPGTVRVPALAFSFPTNNGSILAVDGNNATNKITMATNNMPLSTPWVTNTALWLIWSENYYGQGTGQGYAIDNLSFKASALPTTLIQPINITSHSTTVTGSGATAAASFSFTNAPSLTFSIRATNNMAAPVATWPVIGTAVESPANSGHYQFTDPTPATNSQVYYRISVP